MLDEAQNNYICSVYISENRAGVAFSDISTGEINLVELNEENIAVAVINELGRFTPSEVIMPKAAAENRLLSAYMKNKLCCSVDVAEEESFELNSCTQIVLNHFKKQNLSEVGLENKPFAVCALGALLSYLAETQKSGLERLISLNLYAESQYMNLDITARRNLELTETMRTKDKKGTLLWVLDKTKTAMGKRLIRNYVDQPLLNPVTIEKRLGAVDELFSDSMLNEELREMLSGIYDLERIMTRIVYGNASPRELNSLAYTAQKLPALKNRLHDVKSKMLCEIYSELDILDDISELIINAIDDDPPALLKDGGIIKKGYNHDVDEYRSIIENSKEFLMKIEHDEKEKTGIKTLKIGYNKVFGYYIEVSKSYTESVPETYIRKQTLTNGERYITEELKVLEAKILGARERIVALETQLFGEIKQQIAAKLDRIQLTARAIARLDVFSSFAKVSLENGYVRPDIDLSGEIILEESRHPVVEKILASSSSGDMFVSNSVTLDMESNRIAVITGPNMAGKSTYMRQVALVVLMAQIGCFVPAKSAKIGIVDSIFTRVGASDDLSSGQSTFMVEMNEVAHILKNATAKSLIILDEIGRGTSTFDGMSIARAVVEYIADKRKLGAKTLFATHYHELTELENSVEGVLNYNIAVKKRGDDITFLRRIIRGGADDSYGIEVSKLAGIPEPIIKRAKEILKGIESGEEITVKKSISKKQNDFEESMQLSIMGEASNEVIEQLRKIDLNTITPIEAMNELYKLKSKL